VNRAPVPLLLPLHHHRRRPVDNLLPLKVALHLHVNVHVEPQLLPNVGQRAVRVIGPEDRGPRTEDQHVVEVGHQLRHVPHAVDKDGLAVGVEGKVPGRDSPNSYRDYIRVSLPVSETCLGAVYTCDFL
jgi:hypothetical protein